MSLNSFFTNIGERTKIMWRYIYNNDANGFYEAWFDIIDESNNVIASTPHNADASFEDENNARLISSLSHYHSVLQFLKRCYSTAFIDWLERNPCDWCYVTMLMNGYIFCRKCGKTIMSIELWDRDIIHALELCRELALCEECKEGY